MTTKLDKVPFEEALKLTGFSKFNLLMFMLCFGVVVGMTFEIISVAYVVPASVCELNTSNSQQGLTASLPMLGIISSSHIWGYLADTRGRKKILMVTMFMGFVCGVLATFSPNWIVLCVLKVFSSAGVAGAMPIALTLLSETSPEAQRNVFMILTTSAFLGFSGVMAMITIPVLPLKFSYYIPVLDIHFNSWRLLNLIFSLPSILIVIGIPLAYESPKYLLSIGEEAQALEVLRNIFVINTGKSGDEYKVASVVLDEQNGTRSHRGMWSSIIEQTLPLLKFPLLKKTLILSLLFFVLYMCVNPFIVWLPYMVDAFMKSGDKGNMTLCEMMAEAKRSAVDKPGDCTFDSSAMTMVFGCFLCLAILNAMYSGVVSWAGKKRPLIIIQYIVAVAGVCIGFSRIWGLSAFLVVLLLCASLNFGLLSSYTVDFFPTYVRAMALSLSLMLGRGGAIVGINLLKNMLDNSCENAFFMFAGFAFFGGTIALFLPADKLTSKTSET